MAETRTIRESHGRRAWRQALAGGAGGFAVMALLKWTFVPEFDATGRDPLTFLVAACLLLLWAIYLRQPAVHVHIHDAATPSEAPHERD